MSPREITRGSESEPPAEFPNLIDQVDELAEEAKTLALNLALYLAKARVGPQGDIINRLEPDFIRLVNGTVRVMQELTRVLGAARNLQNDQPPSAAGQVDHEELETRLQVILERCSHVLAALSERAGGLPSP